MLNYFEFGNIFIFYIVFFIFYKMFFISLKKKIIIVMSFLYFIGFENNNLKWFF